MKISTTFTERLLRSVLVLCACAYPLAVTQAEPGPLAKALMGDDYEGSFDVRGWLNGGYTVNTAGSSSYNGPLSFNDRNNEVQMNQFYLVAEKTVAHNGDDFDIGGRADFLYGSDAVFTMANGWDNDIVGDGGSRFYKIAFPQLYVEANLPLLNGISVKAGHFYTPIGYEVVTSPDNFFRSHAFTMQYGEPFTHFGALASTSFADGKVTLTGGAVRGWDNLIDTADKGTSGIAGFTVSPFETTTLAVTGIVGDEGSGLRRDLYSIVLTQKLTESLSYVFQHDHGRQDLGGGSSAKWYGVNNYLLYTINDQLSSGIRLEWFKDADGFRVIGVRSGAGGVPASYYGVSAGLNYKPYGGLLTLRPEVRYDTQDVSAAGADKAYNDGKSNHQVTLGFDAIIKF